ncbi:hypothetical protein HAX54_020151 [Datura stramonium]|uniref:Uncharacterized protein n=1 Tax=Datura stramonium TaxID=4076 RepID=A0ABS8US46_DATST|nr:hypothetical protein [Datura stramonium]
MGLWSPYEDQKLKHYILKHGHGCWATLPINADQFNGQGFENTSSRDLSEYNFSMLQDAFARCGNDINCDFNNVFQPPLKFEDQIFVNGFDEFISWEFNIYRDMMYI